MALYQDTDREAMNGVGHTLHVIGVAGPAIDAVRTVVGHHFHLPTFEGWVAEYDVVSSVKDFTAHVSKFAQGHKVAIPSCVPLGGDTRTLTSALAVFIGHGKATGHWECVGGRDDLFRYLEKATSIPLL